MVSQDLWTCWHEDFPPYSVIWVLSLVMLIQMLDEGQGRPLQYIDVDDLCIASKDAGGLLSSHDQVLGLKDPVL
jgi:hypothetical protein